ncbi:hypothetical protein ACI2LM_13700 [Paenibacillus lautus]|uniref:hypothetical protein n=1 Tax=Paenibacillus lautus TaxID=1401 RepID=UPI00384ACD3D
MRTLNRWKDSEKEGLLQMMEWALNNRINFLEACEFTAAYLQEKYKRNITAAGVRTKYYFLRDTLETSQKKPSESDIQILNYLILKKMDELVEKSSLSNKNDFIFQINKEKQKIIRRR